MRGSFDAQVPFNCPGRYTGHKRDRSGSRFAAGRRPESTPINLVCDSVEVTAAALHPGDEVDFHVSQPVVVGGYIVIPQDAKAVGHIVDGGGAEVKQHVFSTKYEVHPLKYALDYVMSADGGKIKLNGAATEAPVEKVVQAHMFFGHKEQINQVGVLQKGTLVHGLVDHLVHVQARERASATGGYDQ